MKLQRIQNKYITYSQYMQIENTKSYITRVWDKLEDALAYISLMK